MINCWYCKHHSFDMWYDPSTEKGEKWEECLLNKELFPSECDDYEVLE